MWCPVRNNGSVGTASVVAEKESLKRRWVLDNIAFVCMKSWFQILTGFLVLVLFEIYVAL